MLKTFRFLLILSCLLIQACQSSKTKELEQIPQAPKTDLTKASSYNIQLGMGYLKQGDRPRAKKKLLIALKQAPNSADVNAAMGYYFEKTDEIDQAQKYYSKALSLSNNGGAQLNNYGTFLCRQGKYEKAEGYFLKAVKDVQYINTAGAYENAGLCALAIPDEEKAKRYFKSALNQDPSKKESLFELVKIESKTGHETEALALLQQHADLVLNDKVFLSLAKSIALKAGKYEIAAAYDASFNKMEPHIDNSGVNNEYNNHTG